MNPSLKAAQLLSKHGDSARTQADQILALIPHNNKERLYWDLVIKQLENATSNNLKG